MTEPTTERLAKALEEVGDSKLNEMIARARAGYYDDFKSNLAMPCIQLVTDLRKMGQHKLAERAKNGEWDATKEESDAWARSEVGRRRSECWVDPIRGGGSR